MAATKKAAVDFNEIIQADRQRRNNEALAEKIFGKNRRASAPGAGMASKKPGTGPSLASRIGVTKRSVSNSRSMTTKSSATSIPSRRTEVPAGNVDADWTHDLHSLNNTPPARNSQLRRGQRGFGGPREGRLHSALNTAASSPALSNQFNIVKTPKSTGMSIRGLAGPYTVIAENFAPGTTAADIESAMAPMGGAVLKCSIISSNPVTAEIIFESKEGADNVIAQFHNQTADGLVLSLSYKPTSTTITPRGPSKQSTTKAPVAPLGPRADLMSDRLDKTRPSGRYDRYEPQDLNRERRRFDDQERDEVVDGSYGFDDQMETDGQSDHYNGDRGLYSDGMVGRRGREDHGRGRRGDSRDRGRGGDRGRGYR